MFEPQDLPGRYGRVVKALDHVISILGIESVVAGGWAVWRHGYLGRITQDIDIALPADRIEDFLRAASVAGFAVLPHPEGRWPKLLHKTTDVRVDVLPEGARPGSDASPAPTTIRHPAEMGGKPGRLVYVDLPSLIEMKLAAGRLRDQNDVVELVRHNDAQIEAIRQHLCNVHSDYVKAFERLLQYARQQRER